MKTFVVVILMVGSFLWGMVYMQPKAEGSMGPGIMRFDWSSPTVPTYNNIYAHFLSEWGY